MGYYNQKVFPLYTDNNRALLLSKKPVFYKRTKHINIKYYYIRELLENGIIDLLYIPTIEQQANGFTKALSKPKFTTFRDFLALY